MPLCPSPTTESGPANNVTDTGVQKHLCWLTSRLCWVYTVSLLLTDWNRWSHFKEANMIWWLSFSTFQLLYQENRSYWKMNWSTGEYQANPCRYAQYAHNMHTCETINPDGWDRAINLDWRRILFYIRANGSCREMNWLADMHERHWAQMAVLQSMRTGHRALAIIAIRRRAISLMRTHTGHTLDGHWTHIGHTPVPGVLIILNPASIDLS